MTMTMTTPTTPRTQCVKKKARERRSMASALKSGPRVGHRTPVVATGTLQQPATQNQQ